MIYLLLFFEFNYLIFEDTGIRERKRTQDISKAESWCYGLDSADCNEGQKVTAICQSKITEARNASHTASTNALQPAETKGANSRKQRLKSVPHESYPQHHRW